MVCDANTAILTGVIASIAGIVIGIVAALGLKAMHESRELGRQFRREVRWVELDEDDAAEDDYGERTAAPSKMPTAALIVSGAAVAALLVVTGLLLAGL